MVKVYSNGLMLPNTMESSLMVKDKGMGYSLFLMVHILLDIG
jgi:hypothetical protein